MNAVKRILNSNYLKPTQYLRAFSTEGGSTATQQGGKGLVVGVYDPDKTTDEGCMELSPVGYTINESSGGKLSAAMTGLPGNVGKLGRVTLLSNISAEFPAIAVAGLGPKGAGFCDIEYLDEGAENVRIAAGVGARHLMMAGIKEVVVEDFGKPEAAAEGSTLGAWFNSDKPTDVRVTRYAGSGAGGEEAGSAEDNWSRGAVKGETQNIVRCLCETPPNFLTPSKFSERARDLLCPVGVQVFGRDVWWMKENYMSAILNIASSSVEQPIFLELNYCSDDDPGSQPYILVGQGSTFNSGGLCRKKCENMLEADFAGAATILGIFRAVAAMRMPIHLRGFIPLYEHMVGGLSLKTMDILETHGFLVQTPHTDDLHQLALSEAIQHALKNYTLSHMFTLGCLSSTTKAFIGGGATTVYPRCYNTWQHINYAGAVTGDRMWKMPLFKDYTERTKAHKGIDIMNIGKGEHGEPNLIAAVLSEMTPKCIDFTYLDITGSSAVANGYVPYLAEGLFTGAPTRGMIQLLCHLDYCRKQTSRPADTPKEQQKAKASASRDYS